ncbi:hypothetical protein [Dyella jiangningensis]|uniref:Uncharacterized protein n=1 Tax=Dyella jiangningensis TaxID=1379159 RepID=A0A328P5N9_9GAMM|nr:hypothetical protein [Dyella jiangningensis]RAO77578.1 hypothetical protein CA260_06825 [Dyella jiangningensis]
MATDYAPLPDGPVLCDSCSKAGKQVEMQPQDMLPPDALEWAKREDAELQSYRCPACETVNVFRVD